MPKKNLLILFWISVFTVFSGKPAANSEVYLEINKQLVAVQASGEQGKALFKYLNAGSYQLALIFPQQQGKFFKKKTRHQTLTKATKTRIQQPTNLSSIKNIVTVCTDFE